MGFAVPDMRALQNRFVQIWREDASVPWQMARRLLVAFGLLTAWVVASPTAASGGSFPRDPDGFSDRLRAFCSLNQDGASQVDPDGADFSKAKGVCYLYLVDKIPVVVDAEECIDQGIESCIRRFIDGYFSVKASGHRFSGPDCNDGIGCKRFFDAFDKEQNYGKDGRCGFHIGGLATVLEGNKMAYLMSIAIAEGCDGSS